MKNNIICRCGTNVSCMIHNPPFEFMRQPLNNQGMDVKYCNQIHLADLQSFLPYFIDAEFKKGKNKDRGKAILHVALFLDWCKKNVKMK